VISTELCDGYGIVRLDRPERQNALVPEQLLQLVDALERLVAHDRPIILTGAGRAFCAGADLKWLDGFADPAQGVAELVAVHHRAIGALLDLPVPVIAAINGAVAGGGLGLALAPDYRVASERATFTTAYFRLGLTPDGGSSAFLTHAIGVARTMELLLTNRRLSAAEAQSWGLINEVVPEAQLMPRAAELARTLLRVPAYTLRETRRLLDIAGLRNQLQLESVAIRTAAKQPEFRAAIDRFLRPDG
jgi:enoyl-CoA hydratase/carnithine racemase